MNTYYEDPGKTRMRGPAIIAIDQAGFSLEPVPQRIPLPDDSKIEGALVGDLQSLDENQVRTFYYLRPVKDRAVPKWIANLARASHAAESGQVYMVVTDYLPDLVDSCRLSGCGLLRLTADSVFEVILGYSETAPRTLGDAFVTRITAMRRLMESKVEMIRRGIDSRYQNAASLIAGMEDGEAADRYANGFDAEYRTVDAWGEDLSRRLDALTEGSSATDLAGVEALIEAGPAHVSEESM